MNFKIQSRQVGDIVQFDVDGDVSPENIVDLAETIRRDCDAVECRGAIVDCGGMRGAMTAGTIYFTTQEFVRIIGGRIRVAYINPPAHWQPDDDEFSRNVAHNHGGSLEMFENASEAIAWIKSGPPPVED